MSFEFGKMIKCLTARSYRSLQEDSYSQISVGIGKDPESESSSSIESPPTSPQDRSPSKSLFGFKFAFQKLRSGSGNSNTKHLDKQHEDPQQAEGNRYTRFPAIGGSTTNGTWCHRRGSTGTADNVIHNDILPSVTPSAETAFDATHIHLTPQTRTFAHPLKGAIYPPNVNQTTKSASTPPSAVGTPTTSVSNNSKTSSFSSFAAKCLRIPSRKSSTDSSSSATKQLREKSKSDNSLHRICYLPGKNSESKPKLLRNHSALIPRSSNNHECAVRPRKTVLPEPLLLPTPAPKSLCRRSRSLERCSNFRVYPINSLSSKTKSGSSEGSRSLERNQKFLIRASDEWSGPRNIIKANNNPPIRYEELTGSGKSGVNNNNSVFVLHTINSSNGRRRSADMATGCRGDGAASSGFISKPSKGWLHPDKQITREGITYAVRYVGCLEVNTSMKSLDFGTRSQIAKECINRVCEAAGLKPVDRKRKVDRKISHILGDHPIMHNAGANVHLTITSTSLRLSVMETGQIITNHDMPNISFASGGDPDTLDFVAYVAKDATYGRACFVLECGGGLAQDVITTVGQAFDLRFKEYLKTTPRVLYLGEKVDHRPPKEDNPEWMWDLEYYNDLPGKVPPDIATSVASVSSNINKERNNTSGNSAVCNGRAPVLIGNLIDLNSNTSPRQTHDYVNESVLESFVESRNKDRADASAIHSDPFDMQPFESHLSPVSPPPLSRKPALFIDEGISSSTLLKLTPEAQKAQLQKEAWFHGPVSRKEAESLLINDGDFLVRESQGSPGQYVLTGMQENTKKHLLLVDPEGVVRTKDRTFDSVSHLINFHRHNGLPIISAESVLVLCTSISRHKT